MHPVVGTLWKGIKRQPEVIVLGFGVTFAVSLGIVMTGYKVLFDPTVVILKHGDDPHPFSHKEQV
jgi:hypothetical protein